MDWKDEVLDLLDRPHAERELERDLVAPVTAVAALRPQADLKERRVAEVREDHLYAERRFEALCTVHRTSDLLAREADLQRELDRRERELAEVGFVDRLVQNAAFVAGAGGAGVMANRLLKALPGGDDNDGLADLVGIGIGVAGVLAAGSTTPKAVRRERQEIAAERIASEDRVRRALTEERLAGARCSMAWPAVGRQELVSSDQAESFAPLDLLASLGVGRRGRGK